MYKQHKSYYITDDINLHLKKQNQIITL